MSSVVTGHIMISIYQFAPKGWLFLSHCCTQNPVKCAVVKSGRTPFELEALLLFALPLLLTLAKLDAFSKVTPKYHIFFKCFRNLLSDCRNFLIIWNSASTSRTMFIYLFLSAGRTSAIYWSSCWRQLQHSIALSISTRLSSNSAGYVGYIVLAAIRWFTIPFA